MLSIHAAKQRKPRAARIGLAIAGGGPIGGMYEQDYWIYLAKLAAYVLVSLVIGLVLGKPFRSLNHKIEKSKEKSGLMI